MRYEDTPRCPYCKRPTSVCYEPVDERWPGEARAAYRDAGYRGAATCGRGEAEDLRRVGWCYSRALRHPGWSGPDRSDAQRRGLGFFDEGPEPPRAA